MDTTLYRFELFQPGSKLLPVGKAFVELGNMLALHTDFLFHHFTRLFSCLTCLLSPSEFFRLGRHIRIELFDPPIALRHRLFQLLDHAAMGRLPVTQFHFQLMDTTLYRFELFQPGSKLLPVGKAFVELGDMLALHADFLFHHFTRLLSSLTRLLGPSEFFRLGRHVRIELTDPPIALRHGLFQLLDHAAMGRLPVTQFHFQLMDAALRQFQLLQAGSELVPISEPFVELGNMLALYADFLLHHLARLFSGLTCLLSPSEF
jgi:hypothetical protein